MMFYYLLGITLLCLLISFIFDRQKTGKALKIAFKKFTNILPAFLIMLILVSIILYLVPDKMIITYLGNKNKYLGIILASIFGSITLIPGFIAYPLCGILLKKGVGYMVLAAFTTTLMMVGVMTYPVEKEYFGAKVTIIRNLISFFISLIVAIAIGFFFGELI
ncbi:permease [Desulfothermus okinawensis JCM 13304]